MKDNPCPAMGDAVVASPGRGQAGLRQFAHPKDRADGKVIEALGIPSCADDPAQRWIAGGGKLPATGRVDADALQNRRGPGKQSLQRG